MFGTIMLSEKWDRQLQEKIGGSLRFSESRLDSAKKIHPLSIAVAIPFHSTVLWLLYKSSFP
jgi:hypothetical protein